MTVTAAVVSASPVHARRIADIYNHCIANTCVTFKLDPVTSANKAKRIDEVQSIGLWWLVVLGGRGCWVYAYTTQWRARKAYQRSVDPRSTWLMGIVGGGWALPCMGP